MLVEGLEDVTVDSARRQICDDSESKGLGSRQTSYRLRDWLISRQVGMCGWSLLM